MPSFEANGSVALMCAAQSVPSEHVELSKRLALTVHNTGNFFFQEALRRQVVHDKVVGGFDDDLSGINTLVLSLANFIRPSEDFENEARRLEQSPIENVVLAGAGAQAYEYGEDFAIPKGTLRLLKVISERSASIGVRGEYTADLLARNGIKNTDVIGCPSIFWHCDPDFKIDSNKEGASETREIGIHSTPSGYYRDKISELLSFGCSWDAHYIFQNETHIMPLLEKGIALSQEQENGIQFFVNYYNDGRFSPSDLRSWLAKRLVCFFDAEEWIKFLGRLDFVIGCRFHGNVAAALAGVPCLTLAFDTRTKELCEATGLPYMLLEDFDPAAGLDRLLEMADVAEFNALFRRRYARYVGFIEKNKLKHNLFKADQAYQKQAEASFGDKVGYDLSGERGVKVRALESYLGDLTHVGAKPSYHGIANRLRDLRSLARREAAEKTEPAVFRTM